MTQHLSKGRAVALGAGTAGLAAVAVLGGGIASAAGGNPPPGSSGPGGRGPAPTARPSSDAADAAPAAVPSGAPSTRPSGAPTDGAARSGQRPTAPGAGPGVVHGRFVHRTGAGFATEDVQQGTVTDVSSSSLTVVSADGFSETYVLSSTTTYGRGGTAADVAVDDRVSVRAVVTGGTATATSVEERPAPAPRPTATASPTS